MSEEKKIDEQVAPLTISQANVFRLLTLGSHEKICGMTKDDIDSAVLIKLLEEYRTSGTIIEQLVKNVQFDRGTVELLINSGKIDIVAKCFNPQFADIVIPALLDEIKRCGVWQWQAMVALEPRDFGSFSPLVLSCLLDVMSKVPNCGKSSWLSLLNKLFAKFVGTHQESEAVISILDIKQSMQKNGTLDYGTIFAALTPFIGGKETGRISQIVSEFLPPNAHSVFIAHAKFFQPFMVKFAATDQASFVASQIVAYVRHDIRLAYHDIVKTLIPYMNLPDGADARQAYIDSVIEANKASNPRVDELIIFAKKNYIHFYSDSDMLAVLVQCILDDIRIRMVVPRGTSDALVGYGGTLLQPQAQAALEQAIAECENIRLKNCLTRLLKPLDEKSKMKEALQNLWGSHVQQRISALSTLASNEAWLLGPKAEQIIKRLGGFLSDSKIFYSSSEIRLRLDLKEYRLIYALLSKYAGTEYEHLAVEAISASSKWAIHESYIAMAKFRGNSQALMFLLNQLETTSQNREKIVAALNDRRDELEMLKVE